MRKRLRRLITRGILGLVALCIVLLGLSALSNRNLPTHSQLTSRLSEVEKARLAEAMHLRQSLGDTVWPGWGALDTPIIVYNEDYAFLVGYAQPPAGWMRMPQREQRGGAWEPVPDDSFAGQVYYRQSLPDKYITPENFTALVGERWVVTMYTKEYAEIAFYAGFRGDLPPPLRSIFPYRLAWRLIMADTDTYIAGLEHEAFHALQGSLAGARLAAAETANRSESRYPWDDRTLAQTWQREAGLLVKAVRAPSNGEVTDLVRQFLAERDGRRSAVGLSADLVDYERQREWLEGLAKYAELSIGRVAASTPGYAPVPAIASDPAFKRYTGAARYWSGQIDEVTRTSGREGEVRFYYSGMAQAVLLDRLAPGWKQRAFDQGVMLEDLLREAIRREE
jgi:hypothetical protein